MKFMTPQEYNGHYITQSTRLGTLLAKNILCERPVCAKCPAVLRFVKSKVQPEHIAFYCPQCKIFVNIKQHSIYKETRMSLLDIIVLAEANLEEQRESQFLRFREKPLELQFPTVERPAKKPNGVEELSRPKTVSKAIEYETFDTVKHQCQELENQIDFQRKKALLLRQLKIESDGVFQLAAQAKRIKNPNSKQQKYEIRVPVVNTEIQRMKGVVPATPGVGSYAVQAKRPQSAILINKAEKYAVGARYEFAEVPYYVHHADLEPRNVKINQREQNSKKLLPQTYVGPTTYSPSKKLVDTEVSSEICFNRYERKTDKKPPLAQQFVGPTTYDGYYRAKKLLQNNAQANVENSDRWLRSETVRQLLNNICD